MSTTARADTRTDPLDDVFASTSMVTRAPHTTFPTPERDPRDVLQLVHRRRGDQISRFELRLLE